MRRKLFAALVVGALSVAASAQAATVTYYYKFTIDTVHADDLGLFAANGIAAGSMHQGQIQYDDTATNLSSSSGYWDAWNLLAMTSTLPGTTVTPYGITAIDQGAIDSWWVGAALGLVGQPAGTSTNLNLEATGDFGYNLGSPVDLGPGLGHPVLGPPVLTGFDATLVYFTGGRNNVATGTAMLSDTPFGVVPLPAGLSLLLAGLGALGLMRRRRT